MLIFGVKNSDLTSSFFFLFRKLELIKRGGHNSNTCTKAKVYKENAHSVHRKLI